MRKYYDPRQEIYEDSDVSDFSSPMISDGLRQTIIWMVIIMVFAAALFVATNMAYERGFKAGQRYPSQVKASNVSYKWKKVKKAKKRNQRKAKRS